MKKTFCLLSVLFFLCLHSAAAIEAGFEIENRNIFLNIKSDVYGKKYVPEIISDFYASFFLNFNADFMYQSISGQPGVFIKDKNVFPFFRRLRYAAFTDFLSFQIGKDSILFGEGFTKNYFFINAPINHRDEEFLWHVKFDIPVRRFLFSLGSVCDTKSLDIFTPPKWYSFWLKTEYSNPIVFAGFEADILFMPELKKNIQKKDGVFKAAVEVSFVLPADFKLYSNACIPVNIFTRKIEIWGVMLGLLKNFTVKAHRFSFVGELSCSSSGFEYGFFNNSLFKDFVQFTCGIQGFENKKLYAVAETAFLLSDFKIRFSYVSQNVLNKKDNIYGIFSFSVVLNN